MIAKLELITRTIKISLNNPPSLQGGSNQSLQSAYVRAINNVENRANQPNVSFNKISPRLPSTSNRSPNLSLPLLPPFSRYSINVIGPNPRWSTRSAVNRGVFCPRNWISCLSLKRGGNHIPDTISSQNDAICALLGFLHYCVRVKWGNKNITRASNLSPYNGVHNSSPRCRVMIATDPPRPSFSRASRPLPLFWPPLDINQYGDRGCVNRFAYEYVCLPHAHPFNF